MLFGSSILIENERSYVFTHEAMREFADKNKMTFFTMSAGISDWYMQKDFRLRKTGGRYVLCRKSGNKADGYREEFEQNIPEEAGLMMKQESKLFVRKDRWVVKKENGHPDDIKLTIDFVYEPMKIAVLEMERVSEKPNSIPDDLCESFFGVSLRECPLSAFEYFKRKVGICGPPSSGKTETAKMFSHVLNVDYGANAYSVQEYATSFIQKYGRTPKFDDQVILFLGQLLREKDAQTANIVVSDCPTFLNYVYLLHLNKDGFNDNKALYFSKMYKRVLFDMLTYTDLFFLTLREYKENNVRFQSKQEASVIESKIRGFLDNHGVSYRANNCTQLEEMVKEFLYLN